MNAANAESSSRDLGAAGIQPKHADAIARKVERGIARAIQPQAGPSASSMLAIATALGFVLLTAVSGYFLNDAVQERTAMRTELRTAVEANRDRIDAVNERISSLEVSMSDRLARIETLIEERLPPRQ